MKPVRILFLEFAAGDAKFVSAFRMSIKFLVLVYKNPIRVSEPADVCDPNNFYFDYITIKYDHTFVQINWCAYIV